MGLGLVGSLCWGPQVTADGHGQRLGWGLWTAGLSPELGHQTPTTEPPSQKLCGGRAVIWEGEDEEREHLYPKAKCPQTRPPSEGESGTRATVPVTSAALEGCKYWGGQGTRAPCGPAE